MRQAQEQLGEAGHERIDIKANREAHRKAVV